MSKAKGRRGAVKEMGPAGIQSYLKEQVPRYGGMIEHFTSPGKRGVPDFLVTWPAYGLRLVECKKPVSGRLQTAQERDHLQRRRFGRHVDVLWTKEQVDCYVEAYGLCREF